MEDAEPAPRSAHGTEAQTVATPRRHSADDAINSVHSRYKASPWSPTTGVQASEHVNCLAQLLHQAHVHVTLDLLGRALIVSLGLDPNTCPAFPWPGRGILKLSSELQAQLKHTGAARFSGELLKALREWELRLRDRDELLMRKLSNMPIETIESLRLELCNYFRIKVRQILQLPWMHQCQIALRNDQVAKLIQHCITPFSTSPQPLLVTHASGK